MNPRKSKSVPGVGWRELLGRVDWPMVWCCISAGLVALAGVWVVVRHMQRIELRVAQRYSREQALKGTQNNSDHRENQHSAADFAILCVEYRDGALQLGDGARHLDVVDGQTAQNLHVTNLFIFDGRTAQRPQIALVLLGGGRERGAILERPVHVVVCSDVVARVHDVKLPNRYSTKAGFGLAWAGLA